MTVRNELNQPGHFSSFEKQLTPDDEMDDGDDDDNPFVIALEDNGEEEGLLCNPDEIDFSTSKLTIDIPQNDTSRGDQSVCDFRNHSAQRVDDEEATHILVLPSGAVNETTHNSHLLKNSVAHQPSAINAPLLSSSGMSVSDSNNGFIGNTTFNKTALNKENVSLGLFHSSQPMKSSLNFNGAETVHLDSGGIWSEAIFLSTSKGAFVNNNSNSTRDSSWNDNCSKKTGPESTKTISEVSPNHRIVSVSLENGQRSDLTGPMSATKNIQMIRFPSNVSTLPMYNVPRLSGPFPRSTTLPGSSEGNLESNSLNVDIMNSEHAKSNTSQDDTCTCIMCYKGRGVKDPDMLIEQFAIVQKKHIPNLLKRKRSVGALASNKKQKSVKDNHFINISKFSEGNKNITNSSLANITLRSLISAPPMTTSLTNVTNVHTLTSNSVSHSQQNMVNSHSLLSSPTTTTNMFLSPSKVARQTGVIHPTVATSLTVDTTGLPVELNKIASALSSLHVTPSIKAPLMSTQSEQMPFTLYYVDSDKVLLGPPTISPQNKNCLMSLAAGIQKDLDIAISQSSAMPCFVLGNTKTKVSDQTTEHSTAMVKPTILTVPPKDNIYTKSLLKTNLLSPKSGDSLVPLTIASSSTSNTSLHQDDSFNSNSKPSLKKEHGGSQLIINIIKRHFQEKPATTKSTVLQTILKQPPLVSNSPDVEIEGEIYTNLQDERNSILNNPRVTKRTLDFVKNVPIKCQDTTPNDNPHPPDERITKAYIQDWVNKAKNLTTANLKNGEYLEAIDYPEQPIEDPFVRKSSESYNITLSEPMERKPLDCLASRLHNNYNSLSDNIEITSFSTQTLIKEEFVELEEATCLPVNISSSQTVSEMKQNLPQSYHISSVNTSALTACLSTKRSDSSTSTALSNQFSDALDTSCGAVYSSVNANTVPKYLYKNENNVKNVQKLNSGSLLQSCHGSGDKRSGKKSKGPAPRSKRRHSSTVLPSKNGIKLKIKLSDLSGVRAANKRLVDTVINQVSESATKLSSGENTSKETDLSNEIASALNLNLETTQPKIETAEEMFQRFQEQAMQEVFKAQMGVGQVSRSLRPTRPAGSFLDKYQFTLSSGPMKRKKTEVEKQPVPASKAAENVSVKSGSVSHMSLDKDNNLELKKKLLPDKCESAKQPSFSLADYPKLRQDVSFTNKKKMYCTNILAGHRVYVKFNIFENMNNGRVFLVPFFNIGGSRTQFDVEDIEYISRAVVDFDKEERTCARHLLFYAREANKATFLRKETNFNSQNISEKSYRKSCFVLEGFQRTGVQKKTEPIASTWKPDNSVAIEIDRAEVDDDDAEKHFAEMIASETKNMSHPVDSGTLEVDNHLEQNILVSADMDPVLSTASLENKLTVGQSLNVLHASKAKTIFKGEAIASKVENHGDSLSHNLKDSCLTYTDALTQVVPTQKLNPEFDKHTTPVIKELHTIPVIKEEPVDNDYEVALSSSNNCNMQTTQPFHSIASKNVTNIQIKQEALDEYTVAEDSILKLPKSADNCASQANMEDSHSLLTKPSIIQTSDSSEKSSNESNRNSELLSSITDQGKEMTGKDLSTLQSNKNSETAEPASLNKDEDQESSITQGSDRSSSSEDSDENINNLGQLDTLTSLTDSFGDTSAESLHPMQNKITSLVQSLMQRLTQDSPKLPPWLASNTPQVITAKIRHKKSKTKKGITLPADKAVLQLNSSQTDAVTSFEPSSTDLPILHQTQADSSLNIAIPSSCQDSHILSELNKLIPNSSIHLSNISTKAGISSENTTSLPESISTHIGLTTKEGVTLMKSHNDKLESNVNTENEVMQITALALENSLHPVRQENQEEKQNNAHSLKIESNIIHQVNIEPKEQTPNSCYKEDMNSERSTPSDFEIEVGMEEFPSEYATFKPIRPNKVTWNSFSKPYSILVSKEITLPSISPDSAVQVNKTPTVTDSPKRQSGKIEKKNNKDDVKLKVKSGIETPKSDTAESVTSYLSNKLSATSAKAPRLLCSTSNKLSAKPVAAVAAPAITVPEPISTAELSKTPSLSEIFGIEIKKELIYETKIGVKKSSKSEGAARSELRSTQLANKRKVSQMTQGKPSSQVAKKRTSKQVNNNITISQLAKKRTGAQVARKRTSQLINDNEAPKKTRVSCIQSSLPLKSEETMDVKTVEDGDLAKSVCQCYVRLERVDIKTQTHKVTLNVKIEKEDTTLMSSMPNDDPPSKSQVNKKAPQRTSRKQKKKRGRTVPPKKDIVDYYTYMIESLQKKAQLLEEARKKEREEKEKKELEEKEKKAAEETNNKTESVTINEIHTNNDKTESERVASTELLNEMNFVDSADDTEFQSKDITTVLEDCGNETEEDGCQKTKTNTDSYTEEGQNKLTEVDLLSDSFTSNKERQEVNQANSNATTFGKKDIVLCSSLEEDLLKFTDSDKQGLAVEEDLLLAPNINFDEEDEDISSIMGVDVEKLLGLEKETSGSHFIVDSAPDQEKDDSLLNANSGQMLDISLSDLPKDKSTSSDSTIATLPQNSSSEISQSLLLWKNIPEPQTSESSKPQELLSSKYVKNLKFKLKCSAELIKSIKSSKEINKVFGDAASEGNSPTEKAKEEIVSKMVSQQDYPPKCQQPNEININKLPTLKVVLHKQTIDAIERAKAHFKLGKKGTQPMPLPTAKSPLDADTLKLNEQIAEDSKFYLRHSKLNQSLPDDRVAPNTKVKGMHSLTLETDNEKESKDNQEDFISVTTDKSNSKIDGLFHNVHRFTDSEKTSLSVSEAPSKSHGTVVKSSNNQPVKCNVNIDIAKLKLRLNPLLAVKKTESNQKAVVQNESHAENTLQPMPIEKSSMLTSVQKPLPALNTAKLSNILKNVCKQTNANKELGHGSDKNASHALKNPVEGGRTLRNRSKLLPNPPIKNLTKKSPKAVNKSSVVADPPKASTEKEDAKGRSFFDCLQNVQDVNVSDSMRNEETKYVGMDSNEFINILHPFHKLTANNEQV